MAKNFTEPSLRDLLNDPLTEVLMARDGVSRAALLDLLRDVAKRIATPRFAAGATSRRLDLLVSG